MDDASEKNIAQLEAIANQLIEEKTDELDELCNQLVSALKAAKTEASNLKPLRVA